MGIACHYGKHARSPRNIAPSPDLANNLPVASQSSRAHERYGEQLRHVTTDPRPSRRFVSSDLRPILRNQKHLPRSQASPTYPITAHLPSLQHHDVRQQLRRRGATLLVPSDLDLVRLPLSPRFQALQHHHSVIPATPPPHCPPHPL